MARRGIRYLIKRTKQIMILSLGAAIFVALCSISLGQAKTDAVDAKKEMRAALPSKVMKILMAPAGAPIDACLTEEKIPAPEKCQPFFNIDEDALENLLQNYTECLDGHSYFYDFSTQPIIKLTKTLRIYGRTNQPFVIKGLKLEPSESFPKNHPAIIIYGKSVKFKNMKLNGFENGIVYFSRDNKNHELIGGEIRGAGNEGRGITSCYNSPLIEGTKISGFGEKLAVINN